MNLKESEITRPTHRRILIITHNPRLPMAGGRKLTEAAGWNDPQILADQFIKDVKRVSYGLLQYQIVEQIEIDGFPIKKDGFCYTPNDYVACLKTGSGFHQPDAVDYHRLLTEFSIFPRINSGHIDDVWLFAFPFAGYYESIMAGPDSFWSNAPPLEIGGANRRFLIMGFNYQRGVGEMLENLGHHTESTMLRMFHPIPEDANLWKQYIRYDQTHPGQAECGNVHFAPNSVRDYDWGNQRYVNSYCANWPNFPELEGKPQQVNCQEWGGGDIRKHHLWWFKHLPHVAGTSRGIAHNWWRYIANPNTVP